MARSNDASAKTLGEIDFPRYVDCYSRTVRLYDCYCHYIFVSERVFSLPQITSNEILILNVEVACVTDINVRKKNLPIYRSYERFKLKNTNDKIDDDQLKVLIATV